MDESTLIAGLARGDEKAFRELVERYKKKVYFLALDMVGSSIDAEDVSQDVFLKVFRSFGTFRKGAKLGSWLYRVTYNASIDHIRRKGSVPEAVPDEVLDSRSQADAGVLAAAALDPARTAESRLLQEKIALALDKISPQEKAVFLLRHYDDLMLKDIASSLGLSLGSVKSYLFRAVHKLQKELGRPALISGVETTHE